MYVWPSQFVIYKAMLAAVVFIACLCQFEPTQAQSDYKVPDGYIKAPFDGFTGVLVLQPHRASGMFVAYIEGNETASALRERVLARVGAMFFHNKAKNEIAWTTRKLEPRPEDSNGEAVMSLYNEGDKQLQVSIYERKTGPRPFLYGYFAMRHAAARKDDGDFLDFEGKGVKAFEKLWKSFPK